MSFLSHRRGLGPKPSNVGGMVFSRPHPDNPNGLHFECINGPLLHWDDPKALPRELATFAFAVSKLDSRFLSVSLIPRWSQGLLEKRVQNLPVPIFAHTKASTLLVPVYSSFDEQLSRLAPRLKRTLKKTFESTLKESWSVLTPTLLPDLVKALCCHAEEKSYQIPPLSFFEGLISVKAKRANDPLFYLSKVALLDAEGQSISTSQLVVCVRGKLAHYLFGCTEKASLPSCLSTSAAAQWLVLRQCAKMGVTHYDMNGFVAELPQSHPYWGVSEFKKQFCGKAIHYDALEFKIG
jgi:hypothetical protein